jgi:hypothetical protein
LANSEREEWMLSLHYHRESGHAESYASFRTIKLSWASICEAERKFWVWGWSEGRLSLFGGVFCVFPM